MKPLIRLKRAWFIVNWVGTRSIFEGKFNYKTCKEVASWFYPITEAEQEVHDQLVEAGIWKDK